MRLKIALLASALAATTAVGAAVTPASAATSWLKPTLHGLLDGIAQPPVGYDLDGWVVRVNWADLQPIPNGPVLSPNAIDTAIATVRALNARNGTHLGLKLRVFAGIHSPEWAKTLGGTKPFVMTEPTSGISGTVPHFWTPAFAAAYADLQAKLAVRYDNVAEIRETVISQCTTIFAEPMIRQVNDPVSKANLIAAGFSTALDGSCQKASITAASVWKHTTSDLSFNPYQSVDGTNIQLSFPISVMDECRAALAGRCILENNSLQPLTPGRPDQMYAAMAARGHPIAFQTYRSLSLPDLAATLAKAAGLGASSVELPTTYRSTLPATLNAALANGRAALAATP